MYAEEEPQPSVFMMLGVCKGVGHFYAVSVGQTEGGREIQSEGCILNRLLSPRQHLTHTRAHTHNRAKTHAWLLSRL